MSTLTTFTVTMTQALYDRLADKAQLGGLSPQQLLESLVIRAESFDLLLDLLRAANGVVNDPYDDYTVSLSDAVHACLANPDLVGEVVQDR